MKNHILVTSLCLTVLGAMAVPSAQAQFAAGAPTFSPAAPVPTGTTSGGVPFSSIGFNGAINGVGDPNAPVTGLPNTGVGTVGGPGIGGGVVGDLSDFRVPGLVNGNNGNGNNGNGNVNGDANFNLTRSGIRPVVITNTGFTGAYSTGADLSASPNIVQQSFMNQDRRQRVISGPMTIVHNDGNSRATHTAVRQVIVDGVPHNVSSALVVEYGNARNTQEFARTIPKSKANQRK